MPAASDEQGVFLISLDFELAWGIHDTPGIANYQENLRGVRRAVPALLDLFREYDIHATWATVGLLFFDTRAALLEAVPSERPSYVNTELSPYPLLQELGEGEQDAPFFYASALIDLIRSRPHQEIGSHTFSHYYCLAEGQTATTFRADLKAAVSAAQAQSIRLESLVFPRNQINLDYRHICREMGVRCLRGNPSSRLFGRNVRLLTRARRLLDTWVNLTGHRTYSAQSIARDLPLDLPASRFLRPYSPRLRPLVPLQRRRLAADLNDAAKNGRVYHLWWHPHNFGTHLEENLALLRATFDHFADLRATFGMESLNMGEFARRLTPEAADAEGASPAR
jgi:peptidoglycan/xylan/chitin deacetylase (PgdA/CDA1 family)